MPSSANPTEPLAPDASGRVPELDGLRGIAIGLVLLWHWVAIPLPFRPPSEPWLHYGKWSLALTWSGVDLFFVLSGFLLGGILHDVRGSPSYFRTFYMRRVCRIFPLYFAVLIAFALGKALLEDRLPTLFASGDYPLWSFPLYAQNIVSALGVQGEPGFLAVTWSLAIEEQFYLLLPLIVYWIPPRRLAWVLLAGILLTPGLRWIVGQQLNWKATYLLLPCRWDALFMGMLGAYAVRQPAFCAAVRARRWVLWTLVALLGVGVALLTRYSPVVWSPLSSTLGYSVLALFYLAVLMLTLFTRDGWTGRCLRLRPLIKLGQISYGVYLFHLPMTSIVRVLLRKPGAGNSLTGSLASRGDVEVLLLIALATFGLALLSYRFFERPLIRIGHRWKYFPPEPAPSPDADGAGSA